jgi:hypothetical protein
MHDSDAYDELIELANEGLNLLASLDDENLQNFNENGLSLLDDRALSALIDDTIASIRVT